MRWVGYGGRWVAAVVVCVWWGLWEEGRTEGKKEGRRGVQVGGGEETRRGLADYTCSRGGLRLSRSTSFKSERSGFRQNKGVAARALSGGCAADSGLAVEPDDGRRSRRGGESGRRQWD